MKQSICERLQRVRAAVIFQAYLTMFGYLKDAAAQEEPQDPEELTEALR